jgi:hypothetical protein
MVIPCSTIKLTQSFLVLQLRVRALKDNTAYEPGWSLCFVSYVKRNLHSHRRPAARYSAMPIKVCRLKVKSTLRAVVLYSVSF